MKRGDLVLYTYNSFVSGTRRKSEVGLILRELHGIAIDTKFYEILRSNGAPTMVEGSSIKPI
jgi:hypothetical protein